MDIWDRKIPAPPTGRLVYTHQDKLDYWESKKTMDSFLLELLMSDQEKGLYQALLENPQDKATRNAYVDFLKENNRHVSAKQVEEGFTFRLGYIREENSYVRSRSEKIEFPMFREAFSGFIGSNPMVISGAITSVGISPINHSVLSPDLLASIRNHPINRS